MKKFFKRLFCKHDWSVDQRNYPDGYQIKKCSKCEKEVYEDIP